jgi:hypothetical protein
MATLRQIEANRRNAQASTGPRTTPGKAVSRMNALKSGIDAKASVIRGEKPAALEALTAEYHGRFQPHHPEERFLVDCLIAADWQLRRLRRAEAEIWEHEMDASFHLDEHNPIGHTASDCATIFTRIQRRLDSTERSYHRSLDKLLRLQSARAADAPTPPSIGFVPPPAASASRPHSPPPVSQPIAAPPAMGFAPPSAANQARLQTLPLRPSPLIALPLCNEPPFRTAL